MWVSIYQMTSGQGTTYGPTGRTLSEPTYGGKTVGVGEGAL